MDRLATELSAAHGCGVRVEAADLAKPGVGAELAARLDAAGVAIDILVNNAGFGSVGPFWDCDADQATEMVNLNVGAVVDLTRRLLPGMVERRWGRVLNVASTAALLPGPFMAVYYATKAFVRSFSEALDAELLGTGVTATCAMFGPVHSGFQARAGQEGIRMISGPWRATVLQPDYVARECYRATLAGKRLAVVGPINKALWLSAAVTPRRLLTWYARQINTRPGH